MALHPPRRASVGQAKGTKSVLAGSVAFDHRSPEPGLDDRHQPHPVGQRFHVRHGHHGRVPSQDIGLPRLQHDGCRLLCRASEGAISRHGPPEIFNTTQDAQFISGVITGSPKAAGIQISLAVLTVGDLGGPLGGQCVCGASVAQFEILKRGIFRTMNQSPRTDKASIPILNSTKQNGNAKGLIATDLSK